MATSWPAASSRAQRHLIRRPFPQFSPCDRIPRCWPPFLSRRAINGRNIGSGHGEPLDTCPASHSARRSHTPPRNGTRHRIAPTSTHETSRHGLLPTARPTVRQARAVSRAPQRNGRRGYAPVHARPRRGVPCPCGASTALPRDCGEARPAPSGAATNARRFVRRRPRGASDCGRLYHAVITAALTACLADPCRCCAPSRFSAPSLPDFRTPSARCRTYIATLSDTPRR